MRSLLSLILIFTIFASFAYIYETAYGVCRLPVTYSLGTIDERFDITEEEALAAITEAEAVWEGPLERELFIYDEKARLTINFVYDDRQEFAEAEYGYREQLNTAAGQNESIRAQYDELTKRYEELKLQYESQVDAYEARLARYNATVDSYNQEGGAPPEAVAQLDADRDALDAERRSLNQQSRTLNLLVDEINRVGEEGNLLVERYNEGVGQYNRTFGESRQFTQGDYRGSSINIYTFTNQEELRLVLAHEFGHALGVDHVEGRESIMHYLIGEQAADLSLTPFDIEAVNTVCTEPTGWDKIVRSVTGYFY